METCEKTTIVETQSMLSISVAPRGCPEPCNIRIDPMTKETTISTRNPDQACPCQSGKTYIQCCGPYLHGTRIAETAEQLMRSRYCAYYFNDWSYLGKTWHPSQRPDTLEPNGEETIVWLGLQIIATHKGKASHQQGLVEFQAHYQIKNKISVLHEISRFKKIRQHWFYVDGIHPAKPAGKAKAPARNSLCPCGSGKKYKRCCGGN